MQLFVERTAKREFERFVVQATDRLFRTAHLMTSDAAGCEDLVHEANHYRGYVSDSVCNNTDAVCDLPE